MDPIANIEEQVRCACAIQEFEERSEAGYTNEQLTDFIMDGYPFGEAERLAELVLALDEWRRKGGFDPYDTVRRGIEHVRSPERRLESTKRLDIGES